MVNNDKNNHSSWVSKFQSVPPDPIMRTQIEFQTDIRPNKINAGIGMIMNPKTGKPFVTEVVKEIGKKIAFDDVSYLTSIGHTGYLESHGRELVFGEDLWSEISKETLVWAQAMGGTKAMSLAAQLLIRALDRQNRQLLLDPGWPNNLKIFADFAITSYTHENPKSRQYNHREYIEKLKNHPKRAIVVLQVGGYNDDGTERSQAQWDEIAEIIKTLNHQPILDFAYNGLVRGWEVDNYPVRTFTIRGITTFVCVSNSKNVAYNARLGSLYIINIPKEYKDAIQQNLAHNIIRPDYSNPNAFAAQTMAMIFNDETLKSRYKKEIDAIRVNVLEKNRQILAETLGKDYSWITEKKGMFLKLKLGGYTEEQIKFLKDDNAIHGPKSSRLNMGGFDPDKMVEIAKIYKKALQL